MPEGIRLKPAAAAEAAKMADDPIIDIDPSAFSEDGKQEASQSFLKTKWENSERFLVLHGSFDATLLYADALSFASAISIGSLSLTISSNTEATPKKHPTTLITSPMSDTAMATSEMRVAILYA